MRHDEDPMSPTSPQPLGRIGPYELIEELGRGGMGVVYRARRADGQFEMEVAIKRIDPLMQSEELLRRFERERQILTRLKHPGIARLIDEGIGEDGRPYLVMECVEGLRIDHWCDRRHLSISERLELFGSVCEAVDSAHRNLVVHRDLKPSNILIDEQGQPKLLDFGIAKQLDPAPEAGGPEETRTSTFHWTPSYASPEQVRDEPITTASDTYSAGAVLYQILTGRVPLSVEGLSAAEAERVIGEVQPPAPSEVIAQPTKIRDESGRLVEVDARELSARRRSSPEELAEELAGDLDTILLKTLHKGPTHRYSTTAELAEDLRRHAEGLPVKARPDTFGYLAGKFIGRNKVLVSAGVLAFLSLVVGVVVSTWQYSKASHARGVLADQQEQDHQRSLQLEHETERLEVSNREVEERRRLARDQADELKRQTEELDSKRRRAEEGRARAAANLEEVRATNLELERQKEIAGRRYSNTRELTQALIFDVLQAITPLDGAERARQFVVFQSTNYLGRLATSAEANIPILREVVEGYRQLAASDGIPLSARMKIANRGRETLLHAIELAEETEGELDTLGEELLRIEDLISGLENEMQATEEAEK
jgi:serine/threonine protein kinase